MQGKHLALGLAQSKHQQMLGNNPYCYSTQLWAAAGWAAHGALRVPSGVFTAHHWGELSSEMQQERQAASLKSQLPPSRLRFLSGSKGVKKRASLVICCAWHIEIIQELLANIMSVHFNRQTFLGAYSLPVLNWGWDHTTYWGSGTSLPGLETKL